MSRTDHQCLQPREEGKQSPSDNMEECAVDDTSDAEHSPEAFTEEMFCRKTSITTHKSSTSLLTQRIRALRLAPSSQSSSSRPNAPAPSPPPTATISVEAEDVDAKFWSLEVLGIHTIRWGGSASASRRPSNEQDRNARPQVSERIPTERGTIATNAGLGQFDRGLSCSALLVCYNTLNQLS